MTRTPSSDRRKIRVRVLSGSAIAIGPGKADLLRAVAETGSISAAARAMRTSYRRAWLLVHTMNTCFAEPLVPGLPGGAPAPAPYVNLVDPEFKTPSVWKASASYRRRLGARFAVTGTLLYSRTTDDYMYVDRIRRSKSSRVPGVYAWQ